MKKTFCIAQVVIALTFLSSQAMGEIAPVISGPTEYFVVGASVSAPQGGWCKWNYEIKSSARVQFFSCGDTSTQTFAANIVAHKLPDVDSDTDLLKNIIKGRGLGGENPRYETISNKEWISHEKGTVCIRYTAKFKDFEARNLTKDQSFLVMEDFGLICQHPENPNVGITFAISQRSTVTGTNSDFKKMAEDYINSGHFDSLQQYQARKPNQEMKADEK